MKGIDLAKVKIAVELTAKCNLMCPMCPVHELRRPKVHMDRNLMRKAAAELRRLGLTARWLHEMGEPLLYPWLEEAISLFPGAGVSTNATLLDHAMAERILSTPLRLIRLCIDTLDRNVYAKIRTGGDFDRVVANIRGFLKAAKGKPIRIEIQRMVSKLTSHETVEDFRRFFDLDEYPNAHVVEKTCEGLDTPEETELHEAFYGCFQGGLFTWLVILADGRVTHCCYDAHGEQPIGDLKTQSLEEIVNSPRIAEIREAFKKRDWSVLPRCGKCYSEAPFSARIKAGAVRAGRKLQRILPVTKIGRSLFNRGR